MASTAVGDPVKNILRSSWPMGKNDPCVASYMSAILRLFSFKMCTVKTVFTEGIVQKLYIEYIDISYIKL